MRGPWRVRVWGDHFWGRSEDRFQAPGGLGVSRRSGLYLGAMCVVLCCTELFLDLSWVGPLSEAFLCLLKAQSKADNCKSCWICKAKLTKGHHDQFQSILPTQPGWQLLPAYSHLSCVHKGSREWCFFPTGKYRNPDSLWTLPTFKCWQVIQFFSSKKQNKTMPLESNNTHLWMTSR
jgi:hypothetical protein